VHGTGTGGAVPAHPGQHYGDDPGAEGVRHRAEQGIQRTISEDRVNGCRVLMSPTLTDTGPGRETQHMASRAALAASGSGLVTGQQLAQRHRYDRC
jgi:hypothetical protein